MIALRENVSSHCENIFYTSAQVHSRLLLRQILVAFLIGLSATTSRQLYVKFNHDLDSQNP